MYIWIGINVDEQLKKLRNEVKRIEGIVDFKESNLTLPMHISLKMSFLIDDALYDDVVRDISEIINGWDAFDIVPKRIELANTIAWVMMEDNENLKAIHKRLDEFMQEKYNIPQHEYDLDYKFHSTLFMDSDAVKVKQAYDIIKSAELPSTIRANRFIIGMSPEGKPGTYRVMKEIEKLVCILH